MVRTAANRVMGSLGYNSNALRLTTTELYVHVLLTLNNNLPVPIPLPNLKQPAHKPSIKPTPLLLPPARLLRRQKLLLLPINHVLARPQIRRLPRPSLFPPQQLIPQYHAQIERYAQIPRDEVLVVEVDRARARLIVHEHVEVLEDGDEDAEHEREIGAVEAKGGGVGHLALGDALGPAGAHEADVADEDGDPGEQAEDGDEVDEVGEDDFGVVLDVEEGDARYRRAEREGVDGDAAAVGAREDGVAVPLFGEAVKRAGGDVEVAVCGAEDED